MSSENQRVEKLHRFISDAKVFHEELKEVSHLGREITIKEQLYRISCWFTGEDVVDVHVYPI